MRQTAPLELCVPCGLNDVVIEDCICHSLRQFFTASQIDNLNILIIKSVGKQENVKVSFNIPIHSACAQIHITEGFQID